ncbi:MAG: aldolase [Proteobacteria bacterium]|nr:aldolase [Pseudomonadota bacterium]
MKENPLKKILAAGKPVFGTWVLMARHPRMIKVLAACGFDFVLIEMEHSDFDMETVGLLTMVARDNGLAPIVRPPGIAKAHDLTRPLDAGAMGLLLPNVETAEEAERIVRQTKYWPKGSRPMNLRLPATDYKPGKPAETVAFLNDNTLLIAMIETEKGLGNVEAIAAVDGIDGLMVGPDDYTQDIGAPGQMDHPRLEEAHLKALAAARKCGKFAGSSVQNEEMARKWIARGWQWVPYANDVAMILNIGGGMVKTLRGIAGR